MRKPSYKIMYLSGGRKDESIRRMGTVKEMHKDGNQIWVSIISNWTKTDIYQLQQAEKMRRAPTAMILGRSGECNCGSYGHPNEVLEMKYHFPNDPNVKMLIDVGDYLRASNHKYCTYGHGAANSKMKPEENEENTNAHLCSTCVNVYNHFHAQI
jgi:hypothetical protein